MGQKHILNGDLIVSGSSTYTFTSGDGLILNRDGAGNYIKPVTQPLVLYSPNSSIYQYINNSGIGINTPPSARLHVKGSGTTSSTTALLVQNANASASLTVKDDTSITIGGSTTSNNLNFATSTQNTGQHAINYTFYTSNNYPVRLVATATSANGNGYLEVWATSSDGGTATAANSVFKFGNGSIQNPYNISYLPLAIGATMVSGSSSGQIMSVRTDQASADLSTLTLQAGNANYLNRAGGNLILKAGAAAGTGDNTNGYISFYISNFTASAGTTNTASEVARFSINKNLLIGTTTDSTYKLDVSGSGRFTDELVSSRLTSLQNVNNYISLAGGGGAFIDFRANNTAIARMSSGGMFIGSDTSPSARLHVKGSGTTSSTTALRVENSNASASLEINDAGTLNINNPSTPTRTALINLKAKTSTTSSYMLYGERNNGAEWFYVDDSANMRVWGQVLVSQRVTGFGNTGLRAERSGGTDPIGAAFFSSKNVSSDFSDTIIGAQGEIDIRHSTYTYSGDSYGLRSKIYIQNSSGSFATGTQNGIYSYLDDQSIFGTISEVNHLRILPTKLSRSDARLTTGRAIYIENTPASTGIITNQYGIYVGNITTGTSLNYSLYTNQGKVHFGDNVEVTGSTTLYKSGSTVLDVQGSQGQLFSVVDELSGSLMSVNDISGLPILEVFSDDRVEMGTYGNPGLIVTGSSVSTGDLTVSGSLTVRTIGNATQATSVIQAGTGSLALIPSGSGAITARVPDGTTTGGNARGQYAVDLQMVPDIADRVSSGNYAVITGGKRNQASGEYSAVLGGYQNKAQSSYSSIVGGFGNTISGGSYPGILCGSNNSVSGNYNIVVGGQSNVSTSGVENFIGGGGGNNCSGGNSVIVGGDLNTVSAGLSTISGGKSNTASSAYSTISGGQSNTASTNTHATVVGGYQNTASGQYSVAGGYNNTASGQGAVSLGYNNTNGALNGVAIGKNHTLGDFSSTAIGGESNVVSGRYNACLGGTSNTVGRFNSEGNINLGGTLNSTNVSSGIHGITGGFSNTTNANYAIALGRYASATGDYSFAISGVATTYSSVAFQGTAYLYGAMTKGNSFNAQPYGKNAQITDAISRKLDTLSSGATTALSLDGTGTTNLIIPDGDNRAWNVTVKWVAIVTALNGSVATVLLGDGMASTEQLFFKRVGGTSSIVGSAATLSTHSDASMVGCSMGYSVGGSQDLALTFTGPTFTGGGTVDIRVVAKVELTEVAW